MNDVSAIKLRVLAIPYETDGGLPGGCYLEIHRIIVDHDETGPYDFIGTTQTDSLLTEDDLYVARCKVRDYVYALSDVEVDAANIEIYSPFAPRKQYRMTRTRGYGDYDLRYDHSFATLMRLNLGVDDAAKLEDFLNGIDRTNS